MNSNGARSQRTFSSCIACKVKEVQLRRTRSVQTDYVQRLVSVPSNIDRLKKHGWAIFGRDFTYIEEIGVYRGHDISMGGLCSTTNDNVHGRFTRRDCVVKHKARRNAIVLLASMFWRLEGTLRFCQ